MDAFARPLPGLVFFDLVLHAPPDEVAEINRLATTAATPTHPESQACYAKLLAWVDEFLNRRRDEPPCGDVVDAVLAADIDGRPITHDEVLGVVSLLIFGGLDTTAGALGFMMARFCREPEIPSLLRRQPELLAPAVEELLRLDSSLVFMARTATRDTQLRDQLIKTGEKVLVSWVAANRDETEFAHSDKFPTSTVRPIAISRSASGPTGAPDPTWPARTFGSRSVSWCVVWTTSGCRRAQSPSRSTRRSREHLYPCRSPLRLDHGRGIQKLCERSRGQASGERPVSFRYGRDGTTRS